MSLRYFDRNSKRKPGIISEELRLALNVHKDKLPIWIYRMRVLGYPPGYLAQAKVSTLAILDGTGNGAEDGELKDKNVEYNKESFIEYPGFNCPVPQGVSDDWYYLRMPPMLEQQQLKQALKTMNISESVPYKKRRMDITSPSTSFTDTSTPKPSNYSSDRISDPSKGDGSQSTLNSLNDSSVNSSINSVKSDINFGETENNVFIESSEENSGNDCFKTPSKTDESKDNSRKLKLISMGSPMPASERPKRPSLDKWAEGMGELIYFENLPQGYTGVYQNKMKSVIDKIRKNSQT